MAPRLIRVRKLLYTAMRHIRANPLEVPLRPLCRALLEILLADPCMIVAVDPNYKCVVDHLFPPGKASFAGHASLNPMPDGGAIPGVMGHARLDPADVVGREDGEDAFIFGHLVLGMSGAEAESAVVVPGIQSAGGVYGHEESEVGEKMVVDYRGDFDLPGHAPEDCVGAGQCQTDNVGDVGAQEIARPGEADGFSPVAFVAESGNVRAIQVSGDPVMFPGGEGPGLGASFGIAGLGAGDGGSAVMGYGQVDGAAGLSIHGKDGRGTFVRHCTSSCKVYV
jgi:hypothetical protein